MKPVNKKSPGLTNTSSDPSTGCSRKTVHRLKKNFVKIRRKLIYGWNTQGGTGLKGTFEVTFFSIRGNVIVFFFFFCTLNRRTVIALE